MAVSTSCSCGARARACARRRWRRVAVRASRPGAAVLRAARDRRRRAAAPRQSRALPGKRSASQRACFDRAALPAATGSGTARSACDVGALERVAALLRRAPAARDEPAQLAVALPIRRERDEAQPAGEPELRADDEFERVSSASSCFDMRAHDSGDGTLIGDGKRCVAQLAGPLDQLPGCEAPRRKVKLLRQ